LKYKFLKYLLLAVINTFSWVAYSQIPEDQPEVHTKVYKTIGCTKLKLYIYQPSEHNDQEQLPSVVFFHGGGWGGDMPGSLYLNASILLSVALWQ
jgi:acetyl esterase/lipase